MDGWVITTLYSTQLLQLACIRSPVLNLHARCDGNSGSRQEQERAGEDLHHWKQFLSATIKVAGLSQEDELWRTVAQVQLLLYYVLQYYRKCLG